MQGTIGRVWAVHDTYKRLDKPQPATLQLLLLPTCMVASRPGGATRLLVIVPADQPQPNVIPTGGMQWW